MTCCGSPPGRGLSAVPGWFSMGELHRRAVVDSGRELDVLRRAWLKTTVADPVSGLLPSPSASTRWAWSVAIYPRRSIGMGGERHSLSISDLSTPTAPVEL